mgnify:CR=1 FL=1
MPPRAPAARHAERGAEAAVTFFAAVKAALPPVYDLALGGTAVGTGGRHPTYTRYATKDGQWIACGALGGKFETWLIKALGLGAMLDDVEQLLIPLLLEGGDAA